MVNSLMLSSWLKRLVPARFRRDKSPDLNLVEGGKPTQLRRESKRPKSKMAIGQEELKTALRNKDKATILAVMYQVKKGKPFSIELPTPNFGEDRVILNCIEKLGYGLVTITHPGIHWF